MINRDKVFPVHAMKAYGGGVQFHSFLTSALDRAEWLTSHPSCFTPKKVPTYPINRRLSEHQNQSGHFGEKKALS
jgi:hypothetical protein